MQYEAYYSIKARNSITGEVRELHTQKNLITDYGLNYFANGSTTLTAKADWSLTSCGVWLKDFPEPSKALTELIIPYATGNADIEVRNTFRHNLGGYNTSSMTSFDDGYTAYIENTRTYTFSQGYVVGDMYGIYLGSFDTFGSYTTMASNNPKVYPWTDKKTNTTVYIYDYAFSIFSAIKFKDDKGNNKVIPITAIEQLFIDYTLRKYLPKYSGVNVFTADISPGVSQEALVTPMWWMNDYASANAGYRFAFSKFEPRTSSDQTKYIAVDLTSDTGYGESFINGDCKIEILPYIDNSYEQSVKYTMGLNKFNNKLKYMDIYSNFSSNRVTFTPPIDKTNERIFTFTLSTKWGRTEDLVVNKNELQINNRSVEQDFTGWTISNPKVSHNQINNRSVMYLTGSSVSTDISQTIDISQFTLINRRLSVAWNMVALSGKYSLKVEYLDSTDKVLDTYVSPDSSWITSDNIENIYYVHIMSTVASIPAKKIKLTWTLTTYGQTTSYIGITNVKAALTNLTPVKTN